MAPHSPATLAGRQRTGRPPPTARPVSLVAGQSGDSPVNQMNQVNQMNPMNPVSQVSQVNLEGNRIGASSTRALSSTKTAQICRSSRHGAPL